MTQFRRRFTFGAALAALSWISVTVLWMSTTALSGEGRSHAQIALAAPAALTPAAANTVPAVTPAPDTTLVISADYASCNPIDAATLSAVCADSKYVLRPKTKGTRFVRYRDAYTNTLTEVTAGALTNDITTYGILLRVADDDKSYYLIGLQNNGKYGVFIFQDSYTPLVPFTPSDAVNTGTASNRLRVINQGSDIAVYVNDQWLTTVRDERLKQGRIGLFVEGATPDHAAIYDDLRVFEINSPLEIPPPVAQATPPAPTTPQPSPPPADTTAVIVRDFASCNPIDDEAFFARCENGEYVIRRKDTSGTRWIQWNTPFSDAVIEVTGRALNNTPTRYGVVFRADSGNYYIVGLRTDGSYGVLWHDKDGYHAFVPYTQSPAVQPGTAANRIKIVNQGSQIGLYLNDQWINTFEDNHYTQGVVGLFLEGDDTTAEVAYDNLSISTINRPLVLPAPLAVPTPGLPTAQTPAPATPVPPTPTVPPTSEPMVTELANYTFDSCSPVEGDTILGECVDGEFVMTRLTPEGYDWLAYPQHYGDVVVEVDARVLETTPVLEYGLMVRLDERDDAYIFTLNPYGEYSIWTYLDGEFEPLVSYTESDIIGNGLNRLTVIAQGGRFAFYVNDELLDVIEDETLAEGRVGFYIESDEPGASVAFDNLSISQINNPLYFEALLESEETEEPLCQLDPGYAGLLISNGYDAPMTFTIGGGEWGTHDYEIPAGGEWYLIQMPPGTYTYTAFIAGIGADHGERYYYAEGYCRQISYIP